MYTKPHIARFNGAWTCGVNGVRAYGMSSIRQAYWWWANTVFPDHPDWFV